MQNKHGHIEITMSTPKPELNPFAAELKATAEAISAPGKGILAADESSGTIGKRFAQSE